MPEGDPQGGNPAEALQKLLDKHKGDAMALAMTLLSENFDLRSKNRDLREKVPADGSVVLSKADGERWEKFKALGKKPEDIAAALTQAEKDTVEAAKLRRKDNLRDVSDVGYGGSKLKLSVLEDLDGKFPDAERPEYVVKEEKDGKAVTVKHGGKELPLEQFAKENWADYEPALKADAGQQQQRRGGNGGDPPPAGNLSTLERIRQQEKERQEKAAPPATGSVRERWFSRRAS